MRQIILTFLILTFGGGLLTGQTPREDSPTAALKQILPQIAAALEKSDTATAQSLLQKALKIAPSNTTAHTLAGILADRKGDYRTAEKHFALAVKFAPASPESRNNYGAILLRLDRKQEAAREFETSLKINPDQPSALINLAQIRFAENDLLKARELFEKAKKIQPDADVLRALVVISLRLNERERARRDFQEYAAKAGEVKSGMRAELAAILLENELTDEAVRELEAVFALDSKNLDLTILLAQAYLQQKNIKAAGRTLEAAVARGVEDARIYLALAEVYEAAGFLENAIPAMRLAVLKEPKNENLHFRYAMLLIKAKAPAAAVIRLEEAVKELPDSATIWLTLGIAYFHDSKTNEAQKAFQKALAIDPQLFPALAYSANGYVERGAYDEAAKLYERAIAATAGKIAPLHYLLADTLLKIQTADAVRIEKALKKAIALDTDFAPAYASLGTLYARQERWAESAKLLEKAAALEPENAETLYQLGRVLARLKRMDESKAILTKFKLLNETQKEQKEASRRELVRRLANVRF